MKVKLSEVKFNPPDAWPNKDFSHKDILAAINGVEFPVKIAAWHLRRNDDGTFTPLMRIHEWQLSLAKLAGYKTFEVCG